nr:Ycf53 [Erythrotrichia foliiformis]
MSFLGDNITVSKKIQLLEDLDFKDQQVLMESYLFLEQRVASNSETIDCIDGTIYKLIFRSGNVEIVEKLTNNFSDGLVDSSSPFRTLYLELQDLLVCDQLQEADKLTSKILCVLADVTERNWLYFSDVNKIPEAELKILDGLWRIYSKGKFGFSVQRQIWLSNGKDWNLLWSKIGWAKNEVLCRYPEGFIWNLTAPNGHLPLSNQLRGVQTLNALFNLAIWS